MICAHRERPSAGRFVVAPSIDQACTPPDRVKAGGGGSPHRSRREPHPDGRRPWTSRARLLLRPVARTMTPGDKPRMEFATLGRRKPSRFQCGTWRAHAPSGSPGTETWRLGRVMVTSSRGACALSATQSFRRRLAECGGVVGREATQAREAESQRDLHYAVAPGLAGVQRFARRLEAAPAQVRHRRHAEAPGEKPRERLR